MTCQAYNEKLDRPGYALTVNDNRLSSQFAVFLHACVAGSVALLRAAGGLHCRATAIAVLVSLQIFPTASANPPGWQQALERGNFETALEQLKPLADGGDAAAQFALGRLYYRGKGVPQDYGSAAQWLDRAARQDHLQAQSLLGLLYARGLGVKRDFAAAEDLLTRAAERGDLEAQAGLGLLYSSTDAGHAGKIRAHMWWSIAAARGYRHAGASRERLQQGMTPAQIAVAQSLARECTTRKYRQCRDRPNAAEAARLEAEQLHGGGMQTGQRGAEQQASSADPEKLALLRQQYKNAIMRKITAHWHIPPGSDHVQACEVEVEQEPGGIVLEVKFTACKAAGPNYRASIEKAIYASEPLPKPGDPALFERKLFILFTPR